MKSKFNEVIVQCIQILMKSKFNELEITWIENQSLKNYILLTSARNFTLFFPGPFPWNLCER